MKLLLKILLVPLLVAGVLSIYGATLPSQHRVASMARYDRAPAEVWALITDVANWPTWREDIVAAEQRREAGGRVLWLVSIAGEDQPLPLEIMESTEPKRFTLRISPDAGLSFSGTWSFQLSEAHQGTALTIMEEGPGFGALLWDFVDGKPVVNRFKSIKDIPAETDLSRAISKELKVRGFKFVGPTIVYAFMQAVGMVNDHLTSCYRHAECVKLARA